MNHCGDTTIIILTADLVLPFIKKAGRMTISGIKEEVDQKGSTLGRAMQRLQNLGKVEKQKSGNQTYYFLASQAEKQRKELADIRKKAKEKVNKRSVEAAKKRKLEQAKKREDQLKVQANSSNRWLGKCKLLRVEENAIGEMRFYRWMG